MCRQQLDTFAHCTSIPSTTPSCASSFATTDCAYGTCTCCISYRNSYQPGSNRPRQARPSDPSRPFLSRTPHSIIAYLLGLYPSSKQSSQRYPSYPTYPYRFTCFCRHFVCNKRPASNIGQRPSFCPTPPLHSVYQLASLFSFTSYTSKTRIDSLATTSYHRRRRAPCLPRFPSRETGRAIHSPARNFNR